MKQHILYNLDDMFDIISVNNEDKVKVVFDVANSFREYKFGGGKVHSVVERRIGPDGSTIFVTEGIHKTENKHIAIVAIKGDNRVIVLKQ